jgi:Zn-dependent membrane protease YugP
MRPSRRPQETPSCSFDPLYLLIVGPFLMLAMWASWRVRSTFTRFSSVGVRSGMTGAEAAAAVARAGGAGVTIERHQGFLSDHYDPRSKTLRLSPDVHDGRSISAIAVAAHEAGHSIQDVKGYAWLGLRSTLVPISSFSSRRGSGSSSPGCLQGALAGEHRDRCSSPWSSCSSS